MEKERLVETEIKPAEVVDEKIAQKTEIKQSIMKKFPKKSPKENIMLLLGSVIVVIIGIGSGWFLSGQPQANTQRKVAQTTETKGGGDLSEAGIHDETAFPDSAEGVLLKGGIKGEGTHHVDRGLGEVKYVYITSTVIDLQSFVGKNVKVWGETLSPKYAGWLMDVGKIKVVD